LATALGENSIGVFIDHAEQIRAIETALDSERSSMSWPGKVPLHIHIDVGHHREGVTADSAQLKAIANALRASRKCVLGGIYVHLGNCYSVSSPAEALEWMGRELEGLRDGAVKFIELVGDIESVKGQHGRLALSLGATPTTASIQNLLHLPADSVGEDSDDLRAARTYRDLISSTNKDFAVEFHAGVYTTLDMQQLATRARPEFSPSDPKQSLATFANIGIRTMVEVASVYDDRGATTGKQEALIAAGSLALGREPCKSYPGWGVVSPWAGKEHKSAAAEQGNAANIYNPALPEEQREGWIVGRISQEHGILTWEGRSENVRPLALGEKLLIWPNHVSRNQKPRKLVRRALKLCKSDNMLTLERDSRVLLVQISAGTWLWTRTRPTLTGSKTFGSGVVDGSFG
jgi:D-serine deaminase-like pyridoxal phosphate-dependent protein